MKGIADTSQIKFSSNLCSNHEYTEPNNVGVQLDCRNSHADRLDEGKQNGMVL